MSAEPMYELAERLFPICRSITGNGVRETLSIIKEILPDLVVHEVPSGTQVFDWVVPDEWNIDDAFISYEGKTIVDFQANNLHVVGYSEPVDKTLPLSELQQHLYSLPDKPDSIPYVTSYYQRRWGFCLTHNQRLGLRDGNYKVVITSTLKPGSLTYADLVLPGESSIEILISTYICHPSMANNEISGPCVATYLAKWLSSLPIREFTYRFVFIPETIGSIVYISKNLSKMRNRVVGGFNISCVGDTRCYSYMPTKKGDSLVDRIALHVLKHTSPMFKRYTWLDRGSDERQYSAPGVDIPIVSIMRSKYNTYPEYHTSKDDLSFISAEGLEGSLTVFKRCVEVLENNTSYKSSVICEPQMGKRGLYDTLGFNNEKPEAARDTRMDILTYCDGKNSLLDIAELLHRPFWDLLPYVKELIKHQLIRETI